MSLRARIIYYAFMVAYVNLKLFYFKARLVMARSDETKRAIEQRIDQLSLTRGRYREGVN